MANPVTTGTTYAGEFSGKYISAALLSGSTLANGGVTVMPNVKFKSVLQKAELGSIVKDASCDYTASGTLTLTERVIAPKELQVNVTYCKKDLHATWQAAQMGFSAFDNLPSTFEDYVIAYTAEKVAAATESSLWAGDETNDGEFDGFTEIVKTDADLPTGQEVAGATITSSNVITELGKIVDAIPSALYGKEDLHIYVSQNIARAYVRALGGFAALTNVAGTENVASIGANGIGGQGTLWYGGGNLSFDGVKMFVANGLADNDAIAAEKSNLFFGTGLLSNHNEVKVLDMADLDGSQNVRVIMRYTAGVQIGNITDVVSYGIPNSAN